VVIGHGFQFAEPVMEIHAEYPDTWFIVNTAQVAAAPNVASFDNRWGDAGYIAGAVAALYDQEGHRRPHRRHPGAGDRGLQRRLRRGVPSA
jgi:basic membrane protein A and related proteins